MYNQDILEEYDSVLHRERDDLIQGLLSAIRCDKTKVPIGDNVQVILYNSGTPIRSASVQAADLGAYTRLSFVTALPGGTSLSGASLSVKWGTGAEDHKEFTDITDAWTVVEE